MRFLASAMQSRRALLLKLSIRMWTHKHASTCTIWAQPRNYISYGHPYPKLAIHNPWQHSSGVPHKYSKRIRRHRAARSRSSQTASTITYIISRRIPIQRNQYMFRMLMPYRMITNIYGIIESVLCTHWLCSLSLEAFLFSSSIWFFFLPSNLGTFEHWRSTIETPELWTCTLCISMTLRAIQILYLGAIFLYTRLRIWIMKCKLQILSIIVETSNQTKLEVRDTFLGILYFSMLGTFTWGLWVVLSPPPICHLLMKSKRTDYVQERA